MTPKQFLMALAIGILANIVADAIKARITRAG